MSDLAWWGHFLAGLWGFVSNSIPRFKERVIEHKPEFEPYNFPTAPLQLRNLHVYCMYLVGHARLQFVWGRIADVTATHPACLAKHLLIFARSTVKSPEIQRTRPEQGPQAE